jgi:hypothetical protein
LRGAAHQRQPGTGRGGEHLEKFAAIHCDALID